MLALKRFLAGLILATVFGFAMKDEKSQAPW
jgi:hypothetical protein